MIVPNVVPRPPALLKRNTFHYAHCTVYCKHICHFIRFSIQVSRNLLDVTQRRPGARNAL